MKNRQEESIRPLINKDIDKIKSNPVFLFSPSDVGVRRNLGRNGSRYAPQAIFNQFCSLNNHFLYENIYTVNTTSQKKEAENFQLAQNLSAAEIESKISLQVDFTKTIHIGGGHDHIFPLLKAIQNSKKFKNIFILNIDAHCDTRVDEIHHSGTPFRNFDSITNLPTHLVQYGVHFATNSKTTLTPLTNIKEHQIFMKDIRMLSDNYKNVPSSIYENMEFEISKETAVVISLDCDAIDGASMKGVSAVNGHGLSFEHVHQLVLDLKQKFAKQHFLGIYEYNPVFDDLSNLGARSMARLIYDFLY